MANIKQIAQRCGVSVATVSKVFNHYPDISTQTVRLVTQTAIEMGYIPNAMARAMKTNRTYNLGVLFVDEMQSGLGHDYFSHILESFKTQAEKQGYDITFISQNIGGRPMSYLEHCRYRGCDGVMIASVDFTNPQVQELAGREIPVVTIDHILADCSAVMSDNVNDMQKLFMHLYEKGHRKIAYIHGEMTSVTQRRLAGFHRASHSVHLSIPDTYVIQARFHDPVSSAKATRTLISLSDRPTCIIYPDDFSYLGGRDELERAGLKVGQDISAAGYDGIYLSQALRPRLTTLKQDAGSIGQTAATLLIRAVEEPKTTFPEQIAIHGQLLPGDTVANVNSHK